MALGTLGFGVCAGAASAAAAQATEDSEQVLALGRSLFEQGLGRDGREIGARMGAGEGLGLRAGAVACANCHGRDGRGGGEGWVRAPDLRWFALGRARLHQNGAQRPGYDRASLTRALRHGVGADAVALDSTMPRYDLADDEVAALYAYLHALDRRDDAASQPPSLLVLLPEQAAGPAERLLDGWRNCPRSSAADGRKRPALSVLRYARIEDAMAQVEERRRAGTVAALFAPYLIGVETAFVQAQPAADLPVLLPITLRGLDVAAGPLPPVWFALPSQRAQALALARETPRRGPWSVYRASDDAAARAQARGLIEALAGQGIAAVETDSIDSASPVLALSVLPPPGAATGALTGLELHLPAANMNLAAAQAWRERGARVRVAFAYPPRPAAAPTRWVGPEQAWTALGCELLARLPPLPAGSAGLADWRRSVSALPTLRLEGWFEVPRGPVAGDGDSRVELRDWPESTPQPGPG